jgi:hypothetical protein
MNIKDQSGQWIHAGWLHCSLANGDWAEPATLAGSLCACHVELLRLENEVRDGLHYQWCYVLLHYVIIKLMVIMSRHSVGLFFKYMLHIRVPINTNH